MPRIVLIIVQIVLLAGIVLMAVAISQKLSGMADPQQIPPATEGTTAAKERAETAPKPYAAYQTIARRDLFQTPKDKAPLANDINLAILKPTELKLKLWGTITGADGLTRAVIEDQTKKEQAFFRAGEEVASARIKMILREKVVLSVNGEDEVLEIEQPTGRDGPGMVPAAPHMKSDLRPVPTAPPVTSQAPQAPRSIRMKLDQLGPIADAPEDWSNETVVSPVVDESGQSQSGLMINRISPSSPWRRLGIRNGDVVVSINDQPVGDLSDIYEPLLDISEGGTLSLNLKRRGRERQIEFQFE